MKGIRRSSFPILLPFAALIGAIVVLACIGATAVPVESSATTRPALPAEQHIVIFHDNDVHGKIDNYAKVAAILDAERKAGTDVFFFSAGDNFTGDPVIDRSDPPGAPMVELLDRLHLDLLCLGNHEFDYGLDAVRKVVAEFRTISANIQPDPGVLPGLQPYAVLTSKSGVKLVVFGVIQIEPGNGLPSTHPDKVKGLRFSEPIAAALALKKLRSEGQVFIGLTHIGHEQDLALAKQMPELDLIMGGHSHTRVETQEIVNGVLIAQAGSDNQFLGRIDLTVRDGRVVEKTSRLIDLGKAKDEDPAIKAMIVKFHENPAMAKVIAKAPLEITGKNALGSLMTDAIVKVFDLDFAFQNNGGIRVNRLPREISYHDIYTLDPFGNQVVRIDMTAAEIRSLIRNASEKRHEIDLQVAGMTYIVREDASQQIQDIELLGPKGTRLAEDKTYKVGLSSYIASSYRFAHKDAGRSLGVTTAEALIAYLERGADLGAYRDVRRATYLKGQEPAKD
jgi:5'-nucleotidase / UDP-sugar diphosphatase